jgi:hypothetical protein
MKTVAARPRVRAVLAATCVCCALVAGCAFTGGGTLAEDGPGIVRRDGITAPAAQSLIAIGKSTRADVKAALGPAIVIPFDSGYEVWVYRWPGAQRTTRAATELVILFQPSGVVKKTRVRPGYVAEPK